MKKGMTMTLLGTLIAISAVSAAGATSTVLATPTRGKGQAVYVNDARVYPTGYNIADNNYFKLRDIGTLVGFGVEWNGETQTVEISTARTTPSTDGGWRTGQHDRLPDRRQQLCEAARYRQAGELWRGL